MHVVKGLKVKDDNPLEIIEVQMNFMQYVFYQWFATSIVKEIESISQEWSVTLMMSFEFIDLKRKAVCLKYKKAIYL